jgi:hypothetical protein
MRCCVSTETGEHTGADGGPIQSANINATVHKVDLTSLEPEQRDQLRQVLLALKAKAKAEPDEPNERWVQMCRRCSCPRKATSHLRLMPIQCTCA